jgi:[1-hydroxy-2-(trimethylamino)ethyl]phosphonate dioxygenase
MTAMADRLLDAMARSAARRYGGEAVSELEHALQCADLAREGGADEELQLACLLHDVGRYAVDQALVSDTTETTRVGPGARGHHEVGAELITPWVPERVAWSVRMHADAKRYLCAIEPEYFERLSDVSRHTLRLQGGVMSRSEVAEFAQHRWVRDAVALRRWDDEAKIAGKKTRSLEDWSPLLRHWFAR